MMEYLKKSYMYLCVKTPLLSFGAVIVFFLIFIMTAGHIYTDQYETQKAYIRDSLLFTSENTRLVNGAKVYFYINKSEEVYTLEIQGASLTRQQGIRFRTDASRLTHSDEEGFVEIPCGKISILEQLFKGSQNGT